MRAVPCRCTPVAHYYWMIGLVCCIAAVIAQAFMLLLLMSNGADSAIEWLPMPLLLCRLKAMYYDRKRDFIVKGTWFDHPKQ